jgi:hypothetical protein
MILTATSNHSEDLTGVVEVASILRDYNATTVIEVTIGMLIAGVGETEDKTLPPSSVRDEPLHKCVDLPVNPALSKRHQKNPISKEKDENYWKQRGHQEGYKGTLSQKTMMNAMRRWEKREKIHNLNRME